MIVKNPGSSHYQVPSSHSTISASTTKYQGPHTGPHQHHGSKIKHTYTSENPTNLSIHHQQLLNHTTGHSKISQSILNQIQHTQQVNPSAATMLLNNLLVNLNEKENTHQSFLQTFNSGAGAGLSGNEASASNALYQFLKSKNLSKEVAKKRGVDHFSLGKDIKSFSQTGSRAYIDPKEIQFDDCR